MLALNRLADLYCCAMPRNVLEPLQKVVGPLRAKSLSARPQEHPQTIVLLRTFPSPSQNPDPPCLEIAGFPLTLPEARKKLLNAS